MGLWRAQVKSPTVKELSTGDFFCSTSALPSAPSGGAAQEGCAKALLCLGQVLQFEVQDRALQGAAEELLVLRFFKATAEVSFLFCTGWELKVS